MEVDNVNLDARSHKDLCIRILPIPTKDVIFAEIGDASLQHDVENKCQGAWLIAATTRGLLKGEGGAMHAWCCGHVEKAGFGRPALPKRLIAVAGRSSGQPRA